MNTVKEKTKVKLFKILSVLLFIGSIIFAVTLTFNSSEQIKDDSVEYFYNTGTNKTTCILTLEFYQPVVGDFTLYAYDTFGNLLYDEEHEISELTDKFVFNFIVRGEAKRFEIDDYFFSTSKSAEIFNTIGYILCIAASIFMTLSMRMRCNSYYFNGQRIVVYAGLAKCYLKVNGTIYDEQKNAGKMGTTLFTTLENGDRIQATISRGNKIYLTVNDLNCPPEK